LQKCYFSEKFVKFTGRIKFSACIFICYVAPVFLFLNISVLFSEESTSSSSGTEWNPYRELPDADVLKGRTKKRAYVRGTQQGMGTICSVSGDDAWVVSDSAQTGRGKGMDNKTKAMVGDKVSIGNTLITGKNSSVELLLGSNARVRIDENSEINFAGLAINEKNGKTITLRKINLESGQVRARVRKNIITPSPVLLISVGYEIFIGKIEYSVKGGVDILVSRADNNKEAVLKVLNGAAGVDRGMSVGGKSLTEMKVGSKTKQVLPEGDKEIPLGEKLSNKDVAQIKLANSFSNEKWKAKGIPPRIMDPELDGP
jgi:hypothetical protein